MGFFLNETSGSESRRDQEQHFLISGLNCGGCVSACENKLASLKGVAAASVRYESGECSITFDADQISEKDIVSSAKQFGYRLSPFSEHARANDLESRERALLSQLGVAGIAMMQVGMISIALHFGIEGGMSEEMRQILMFMSLLITSAAIVFSGRSFFLGFVSALKARHLNMDVSLTIAILASYLLGISSAFEGQTEIYFESLLMLIFLILFSRFIETKVRQSNALAILRDGGESRENVSRLSQDGKVEWVSTFEIQVGDIILVSEGDQIPADGELLTPACLDESAFSGESSPYNKGIGDEVFEGTFNRGLSGLAHGQAKSGVAHLKMKVSAVGKDTRLFAVNDLAEQALKRKAKIVQKADLVASYFLALVFAFCFMSVIFWSIVDSTKVIPVALSLLIAACPCALSIATPTAVSLAISSLRKQGILVNSPEFIEKLLKVDHLAFDKTGTLTDLRLSLEGVELYPYEGDTSASDYFSDQMNKQQMIQIAGALEETIQHPIADLFRELGQNIHSSSDEKAALTVKDQYIIPGKGVTGSIGKEFYALGNKALLDDYVLDGSHPLVDPGMSLYLIKGTKAIAGFKIEEELLPGVKSSIASIKDIGGFHLSILSGDNANKVSDLARRLGIDHAEGGLSPADKLESLDLFENKGYHSLMIGDGNNDFPAQSFSFLSLALPNSSGLSKLEADIVFLRHDMFQLAKLFDMSRFANKILRQGFAWSLLYNVVALSLAFAGLLTPLTAALGMSLSSILVVSNTLRVKSYSDKLFGNEVAANNVEEASYSPLEAS